MGIIGLRGFLPMALLCALGLFNFRPSFYIFVRFSVAYSRGVIVLSISRGERHDRCVETLCI